MTHTVTFAIRANDLHRYVECEKVKAFDPGIIGPSDGHKYSFGALVLITAPIEGVILVFPPPLASGFPIGIAARTSA
ncbi:hypothetical protein HZC00_05105 [Candidatus Kaiserbacteria bacterium]|nr:hypothetical protein [Candidatus Kaiserbacteria bacterium]